MSNPSFDLESRKDVTGFYAAFSKVPLFAYSVVPPLAGIAGGNSPFDPVVGKFFAALSCKRLSLAISGMGTPTSVSIAGLGLGMTFIVSFGAKKLAVRVKNELRERQVHCFWDEQPAFLVEDAGTRFKREAQTLSKLSEKGISPKPLDWDAEHICVEFIDGRSLFQLAKEETLSRNHLEAAFSAMDRMHKLGVSHADANLANFLLTGGSSVKLLDFELAYDPKHVKEADMPKADFAMFMERFNQYLAPEFKASLENLASALESKTGYSLDDLLTIMRKYPVIFKRGTDKLLERIA